MPIYDVEGPDGKIYSIDAPDVASMEKAAMEIFSGIPTSNSPVTSEQPSAPQEPERGLLQRAGDFASDLGGSTLQTINEGLNSATFGATGLAQRYLGGGVQMLADGGSRPEMSYSDYVNEVDKQNAQLRDEFPVASISGSIAGAVAPAVVTGAGTIANKAASTMLGNGRGAGVAGRLLASLGFGAAENAAIEAGRGNIDKPGDLVEPMAVGGILGLLGQGAGEVLEPGLKFLGARLGHKGVSREASLRRLGNSLLDYEPGPGNIAAAGYRTDPDQALADLYERAGRVGGPSGTVMGETSDDFLRMYAMNAADPDTIGVQKPTKELAERRVKELGGRIRGILDENLTDVGRASTGQDYRAVLAERQRKGKELFQQIFDTPAASSQPVMTKQNLINTLYDANDRTGQKVFDLSNATIEERNTWERLEKGIRALGYKDSDEVTMKMLQNFKRDSIDPAIQSLRNPNNARDGMSLRSLSAARSALDDTIADINSDYKTARQLYAQRPEYEAARKMGRDFLKGTNTTMPLTDALDDIASLNPGERAGAQDGALDWLMGQLDQTEQTGNFAKKLRNDNPAMLERIDALFGTALSSNATSADDVLETVGRLVDQRKIYKRMGDVIENNAARGVSAPNMAGQKDVADVLGIGAALSAGQPAGSSTWTRIRRLLGEDLGIDSRTIAEFMQAGDQTRAMNLIDEIMAVRSAPRASNLGGLLGSGLGVGYGSIMDIHR